MVLQKVVFWPLKDHILHAKSHLCNAKGGLLENIPCGGVPDVMFFDLRLWSGGVFAADRLASDSYFIIFKFLPGLL